jgi:hypothetical protein
MKKALVQLNSGDAQNPTKFLQKSIKDIEDGKIKITEQE